MTTKSTKSSSTRTTIWGVNKVSFYTICAVAVLYLISLVLSLIGGINFKIISALQGVATAIMISIVAVLAWRYVRVKPAVWKVLYIVCLLVVIVGIIIPLI